MYQPFIKSLFEQLKIPERLLNHSIRVAIYAKSFGEMMKLKSNVIDSLYYGSLIHDIGKLYISPDILYKKGKLNFEEFEQIKMHPVIGYAMIEPVDQLKELLPIVRSHHERIDGHGYPDGVAARDLPLTVRIVSIMDAFDAMTSDRSYGTPKSIEEAVQELHQNKAKQFDAYLVDLFVEYVTSGLVLKHIYKQLEMIRPSFVSDTNTLNI